MTVKCCAVPQAQAAAYIIIIDDILAKADLQTISAKRIRKELQQRIGTDLSDQKVRSQAKCLQLATD